MTTPSSSCSTSPCPRSWSAGPRPARASARSPPCVWMPEVRDVVVVGGSIAALTAVETLRMEAFDGRITVLSDEDLPPYTRVPLSKGVLAGRETAADVVLAPPSDEVDLRLRTPATGLDTDNRVVLTPAGPIPYDGLVIATGARARRIGTAN